MRILHVYKTYYPDSFGGIEQVIRQLCIATGRLGVENEVLTLTRELRPDEGQPNSVPLIFEGNKVHRVKLDIEIASSGFSFAAVGKLTRLANDFDVIHYHFPWPFMDLAHFLGRVHKPSVVSYHLDIVRQKFWLKLYQPLQHLFLDSVDRIIAASPNYAEGSATLQRYRDKLEIITYGLDKSLYPTPSATLLNRWRERCGPRFFLFVGVLRYYKGLHILLDAVKGVDYPVVIVGAGPLEDALKQQARQLKLDHVIFLGAVSDHDKVALLTLCYALVFPSHLRSESFGISLLEGAMYGKPMVSCEIGSGNSYINLNGETGLVVPPANPAALQAALRTLWDNPDIAHAMGQRAEARYWKVFTASEMARRYVALYRAVIEENQPLATSNATAATIIGRTSSTSLLEE